MAMPDETAAYQLVDKLTAERERLEALPGLQLARSMRSTTS